MLCIFDATVIRIGHTLGRTFTGKDNLEGDQTRNWLKCLKRSKSNPGIILYTTRNS